MAGTRTAQDWARVCVAWWLAASAGRAVAQEVPVEVAGGPDAGGRSYVWRLTNRADSPIVAVEFPHYGASVFSAPDRWRTDCTNLVNVGASEFGGMCRAETGPQTIPARGGRGLAPGESADFWMQCAAGRGRPGTGVLRVTFADGRTVRVPGVAVPQAESVGDRYVGLIGLAVLAGVLFLYNAVARRRRPPGSDAVPAGQGDSSGRPS